MDPKAIAKQLLEDEHERMYTHVYAEPILDRFLQQGNEWTPGECKQIFAQAVPIVEEAQ
jgi:hypothetical protein